MLLFFNPVAKAGSYEKSMDVKMTFDGHAIETFFLSDNLPDSIKVFSDSFQEQTKPVLKWLFQKRKNKNKKLIAALLAFPFPFGIVGLHRIYLGTSPHVPIVYIATIGGGLGVLPLIDFILILSSPDIEQYINNQQVFMWKP